MNESLRGRDYSPVGRRITEMFAPKDRREEYFERGLVATNNLGFKMHVYEQGPDSELGAVYSSILTSRSRQLLEKVHTEQPDLWEDALDARQMHLELLEDYLAAVRAHGSDSEQARAVGVQSDNAYWENASLMSRVFNELEQAGITFDEAADFCR